MYVQVTVFWKPQSWKYLMWEDNGFWSKHWHNLKPGSCYLNASTLHIPYRDTALGIQFEFKVSGAFTIQLWHNRSMNQSSKVTSDKCHRLHGQSIIWYWNNYTFWALAYKIAQRALAPEQVASVISLYHWTAQGVTLFSCPTGQPKSKSILYPL